MDQYMEEMYQSIQFAVVRCMQIIFFKPIINSL